MKMQLLTNQEFKHYVRFQNDDLDLMALSTSHHNHEIGLLRPTQSRILQGEIFKRETKTKQFREMFLDWFNNFLTIERFAEYYGITETYARIVIKEGRKLQEDYVRYIKSY